MAQPQPWWLGLSSLPARACLPVVLGYLVIGAAFLIAATAGTLIEGRA